MASSTFEAERVLSAARRAFQSNEKARELAHEDEIRRLMGIQLTKWEWRSLLPHRVRYYRDREAAEVHYGMRGENRRSLRWWTDQRFNPVKVTLRSIMTLALSAKLYGTNGGLVTLDDHEATLLGLNMGEEADAL
jgi:hypothetical protein